jgi:glycosyltransferase involved in cell wall biosynthesis
MQETVELFILNYNGLSFLNQTIESVLAQTYPFKKVILSDNGSTDKSVTKARLFENRGLEIRTRSPGTGDCYSHYNLCLEEVCAPFVGIFHGDDLYEPTLVEKQIQFFEAHPEIDAVLTAGIAIDSHNQGLWMIQIPETLAYPILKQEQLFEHTIKAGNSFLLCPSALFRSSVFKKIGKFKAEYPYCGDLEMWFRILFYGGGLGYLNEPLIRYRMSTSQGSHLYENAREEESEFFKMTDTYLKKFPVSSKTLAAYEALRHLDHYQAGLNRLAKRGEFKLFQNELKWFYQPKNQQYRRQFGFIDRIKLFGGRFILPFSETRARIPLAQFLNRQTDVRLSGWIKMVLKFKRIFKWAKRF